MSLLISIQILILKIQLDWTNMFIELNKIAINNGLITINTSRHADTKGVAEAVSELQGENVRLARRTEVLSEKINALRSRGEGKIGGILS